MHLLLLDQRGEVGQEPLVYIYTPNLISEYNFNFWFTLIDYKLTCKTGMFKLYILMFAKKVPNKRHAIYMYMYLK